MEAVPRMPMIWLDLKEAGEFQFSTSVKQVIGSFKQHDKRYYIGNFLEWTEEKNYQM